MECEDIAAFVEVASTFEPAGAELIAARSLERRRDWKFVLSEDVMLGLLKRMTPGYQVLLADGAPLAQYETHYFDTEDLHCYREHRRGRSRRHKVRLRSYLDRALTTLEVKTRDARGVTHKSSLERAFGGLDISDKPAQDFISLHSDLSGKALRLSVSNAFRRITLLGVEHPERVTFDIRMAFTQGVRERALRCVAVAEVKSESSRNGTEALRLFRSARLRPQGFSKYCLGTALLNKGLAANRFLPVLRQVARLEEVA